MKEYNYPYQSQLASVVKRLTGRLEFAGETNTDNEVLLNLYAIEPMLFDIISTLADNAKNRDRIEYSISKVGKESYDILKEIQIIINTID
ncbi:protein of unknown function [Ruminococcaceae bacterium BL-6]|nr:protein of unknown function [Ruminococcaceae bacterium BL-6]